MEYKVNIQDGKNDMAEQTNQIQNFITQGMDLIICNPVGGRVRLCCSIILHFFLKYMDFSFNCMEISLRDSCTPPPALYMTLYRNELENYFGTLNSDTVEYKVNIQDGKNDMAEQTKESTFFFIK